MQKCPSRFLKLRIKHIIQQFFFTLVLILSLDITFSNFIARTIELMGLLHH